MELLAIALVLIFVLHLIDKHNRWWQALKLTVGLVVLGVVGVGGLYGWQKYQDYRQEKQEQVEAAVQEAAISACVSRLAQIPLPKDAAVAEVPADIKTACDSNSDATTYRYQPITIVPDKPRSWDENGNPIPAFSATEKSKAKSGRGWAVVTAAYSVSMVKRCVFDVGQSPCGYFDTTNGEIAHLNKGDRVQLLSDKVRAPDGTGIYEVTFQQWTGWVDASNLALEKAEEK